MIVKNIQIGNRAMLVVGDHIIPIDRIKCFDLDPPNGGCDNSVRIITDDPDDNFIWAYENADSIRKFLEIDTKED